MGNHEGRAADGVVETMALCVVVLRVVDSVRGTGRQGIVVGAALTVLIFFFAPISGGSFNPFRSLGPAPFSGALDEIYVYLICPTVAAVLAGTIFRAARSPSS